jgi:hypothetical protein
MRDFLEEVNHEIWKDDEVLVRLTSASARRFPSDIDSSKNGVMGLGLLGFRLSKDGSLSHCPATSREDSYMFPTRGTL